MDIPLATVSICYSRTLRISSFDFGIKFRRLIITTPDDVETKRGALSSVNGSLLVYACALDGVGFHAAYNKARYLNAGLRELRRRGERAWVVLLDADIFGS